MSTDEKDVSTAITTTVDGPGSPEPRAIYADQAQELVIDARRWRDQIPRFAIPPTSDATRRLSSAASVPPAFVELTNIAVTNEPVLVRREGATPTEIRDLMSYADAFGPLADEL